MSEFLAIAPLTYLAFRKELGMQVSKSDFIGISLTSANLKISKLKFRSECCSVSLLGKTNHAPFLSKLLACY